MRQEIVYDIFSKIYPDISIKTLEIIPRQQLNEDGNWVEETPSIFVGISHSENLEISSWGELNLTDTLTNLTGREFNVFLT